MYASTLTQNRSYLLHGYYRIIVTKKEITRFIDSSNDKFVKPLPIPGNTRTSNCSKGSLVKKKSNDINADVCVVSSGNITVYTVRKIKQTQGA